MSTTTSQIQLKLSLSQELNALLKARAKQLGLPVTQFVKHLIIKEIESQYPTYEASEATIQATKKAMKEIDKAVLVTDVKKFLDAL